MPRKQRDRIAQMSLTCSGPELSLDLLSLEKGKSHVKQTGCKNLGCLSKMVERGVDKSYNVAAA